MFDGKEYRDKRTDDEKQHFLCVEILFLCYLRKNMHGGHVQESAGTKQKTDA